MKYLIPLLLIACSTYEPWCGRAIDVDADPCGVIYCNNSDDWSEYRSGDYYAFSCTWYDATTRDGDRRYLDLTWSGYDGACLELTRYTDDPFCY